VDNSTIVIGDLDELDNTIVIVLSCLTWSQVLVMTALALLTSVDCRNVVHIMLMRDSCGVLTLVVLSDWILLTLLMRQASHHIQTPVVAALHVTWCEPQSSQLSDMLPAIQTGQAQDQGRVCPWCENHVGECLMTQLNHGVRSWVSAGDNLAMSAALALKQIC